MAILLILPLAVFALLLLFVGSVLVAVEISERRRTRHMPRRLFRPVVIEGGKAESLAAGHEKTAPEAARLESALRLVQSAPR